MKEILLAAVLVGAIGFVIGFAIESLGRASRRDAKRRNQEPLMVVPPPAPIEWWVVQNADDEPPRAPRGRIDRFN